MGWTGREVLAGGNRRVPLPHPRLARPPAGGPARPYLGLGVRGGDGRVPRRAGRRLRRRAYGDGLGLGRRPAPRLRLLRAALLGGVPRAHGCSALLPRPAAGSRLPKPQGRGAEREPRPREVPRAPSAPTLLLRTRPDCE